MDRITQVHDALAASWAATLAKYGPLRVEIFGLLAVQMVMFWGVAAAYMVLPLLAPGFSARHKIQPAPKQATAADIRHCTVVVLRNNVLATVLSTALTLAGGAATDDAAVQARRLFALRIEPALPGLVELVRDVLLSAAMREVIFYYTHRALHQPRWYRAIHKTHHRFVAPMAFAAQYAHPVEHIVANMLPIALPPMLLHSHVLTYWAFISANLIETATVHSGYDFFDGAARMHDAHHEKFNLNYGVLGIMDWLHGTDGRKKPVKVA